MIRKNFISIMSFLFIGVSILHAETIRIMPLGDSITYDDKLTDYATSDDFIPRPSSMRTGYRSHLDYSLHNANYAFDFVGSVIAGQSILPPFDPHNEGHPGWTSFDIAEHIYGYLEKNPADIILLHIGSNDHSSFTGGIESILNEIDLYENKSGLSIRVLVALIIDRKNQNDATIKSFNENIKTMVGRRITNGDALTLVDMYRGAGLTYQDYADNTHPSDVGYQKMADVWFRELMKPYNPTLNAFPYTLVESQYIQSITINETATSIEFVTEVPDTGITF